MNNRCEPHAHTMFSNIRLLDCINRPEKLIDRAIDFNENSEFKDEYVANIFTIKDSDSGVLVGIKVERRTNDNSFYKKNKKSF